MNSRPLVVASLMTIGLLIGQEERSYAGREIPRVWDETALADWATPIAGLNLRPGHFSAEEYYRAPVDNHRTYPVYEASKEPAGYWEMLHQVGPKPLVEPEKLKTEADWIEAGRRVFDELDHFTMRSYDPDVIAKIRSSKATGPDGRIGSARWIPTGKGLAIGLSNCESCHARREADGRRVPGPPVGSAGYGADRSSGVPFVALLAAKANIAAAPFLLLEPMGMRAYRAYGVPWIDNDIHGSLKQMPPDTVRPLVAAANTVSNGIFARWNGSPYYPAKIPDLIGVRDRRYLDATATHLNRGIGDIMRYAALVSYAESPDFGNYRMLTPEQRRVEARPPDESLFALALYIYSLKPPPNPNRFDEKAQAGQKLFEREGCIGCHLPPIYTSNKITLAEGFMPKDHSSTLDLLPISVGTDAGLALKTRKGTGYYKVPSLKGVWYRGRYLHDGSVASLEEMFDPDRLSETHIPGGWRPPGTTNRPIQGHRFGLAMKPEEREQLIAFLRTL
jgi:mono/diheme cytochrome c family protein